MPAPSENRTLYTQTEAAKTLLANIRDVIGDDEEMTVDAVEGETGLMEAIDAGIERLDTIKVFGDALDAQIKKLSERKARLTKQHDSIKQSILVAMATVDVKTLERPTATLTRTRLARKLVITAEADVPADYWRQPDPVLDKKALLAALKERDDPLPGCELSNGGETLNVRRG